MQDELDEDLIPEHIAHRRGMAITKNAAGRIVTAQLISPFVIDQLLEREIIDRDQHFYAIHFISMRKVFLRGVATFKTVTLYDAGGERPPGPKYPIEENDYLRVMRSIPHAKQKIIVQEVCDDLADSFTFHRMAANPHGVRDSFRALANAVQFLWDDKEAKAEAQKKVLALENGLCDTYGS